MLKRWITLNSSSQTIRNIIKQNIQIAAVTSNAASKGKTASLANEELHQLSVGDTNRAQFSNYTEEQNAKILNILNTNNQQKLLSYEISKMRANKLCAWKERNGDLQNLEDLLLVDGFGLKVAEKLFRSLLDGPRESTASAKSQRPRTAPFITPNIAADQLESIRSCVSVRIGVSSVTWARLELANYTKVNDTPINSPCLLTHWQHHEITEKKLHLNELVQRCLYIDHLIPKADCYIFENPQMAQVNNNPNTVQQNIYIQKSQITAVISFALCARRHLYEDNFKEGESTNDNNYKLVEQTANKSTPARIQNLFYLRRFLAARLFNNLVGTERVSSEETILQLMRTCYNNPPQEDFLHDAIISLDAAAIDSRSSFCGNVQFPQDMRHYFSGSERYHREFLGQALLLNLAFVRLVLLQDPGSIALVSRNYIKDKEAATIYE